MDGKKLTPKYTGRFGDWDQKKVKKKSFTYFFYIIYIKRKKKDLKQICPKKPFLYLESSLSL